MRGQLRELGQRAADRLHSSTPKVRRQVQMVIGALFVAIFVVASFSVDRAVHALNQVAGSYGFRSNVEATYASDTSSDNIPNAPTSFSCETPSRTSGTISCGWTAVSQTVASTNYDNHSAYEIYYATSSSNATRASGTRWGTANDSALSTRSTNSTTLSGLTAGTTYFLTIYALDSNSNYSAASSTVSAIALSGGGGGGSIFATPAVPATPATPAVPGVGPAVPATPATPAIPPSFVIRAPTDERLPGILSHLALARTTTEDQRATSLIQRVMTGLHDIGGTGRPAEITVDQRATLRNFVAYGVSGETNRIGSGERASAVENFARVFGEFPKTDVDYQAAHAMVICENGLPCGDIKQIRRAEFAESDFLAEFQRINGRFPCKGITDEKVCAAEWRALEILTYGYKPLKRNLGLERKAIIAFKRMKYIEDFKGRREVKQAGKGPTTIGHWNAVRACVYGNPQTCPLVK
ncbi:hypothetical protein HY632_00610 [Candidatus Uhrbacteria bacterium]|nr:hypothetical protein [Candidatus Uhrbacteria bacterium]